MISSSSSSSSSSNSMCFASVRSSVWGSPEVGVGDYVCIYIYIYA